MCFVDESEVGCTLEAVPAPAAAVAPKFCWKCFLFWLAVIAVVIFAMAHKEKK